MFPKFCFGFFLIFILLGSELRGQEYRFSILVGGKKVGELVANKNHIGDETVIDVKSDASVKILWKRYARKTYFYLKFSDSTLLNSKAVSYFNDELEDSVLIRSNKYNYQGYLHPDEKKIIKMGSINMATSNLFFEEPSGVDSVYSERYLAFLKLSRDGDKYELHMPDGTINSYSYVNNQLQEIFIDRPLFNLRIQRQELTGE